MSSILRLTTLGRERPNVELSEDPSRARRPPSRASPSFVRSGSSTRTRGRIASSTSGGSSRSETFRTAPPSFFVQPFFLHVEIAIGRSLWTYSESVRIAILSNRDRSNGAWGPMTSFKASLGDF